MTEHYEYQQEDALDRFIEELTPDIIENFKYDKLQEYFKDNPTTHIRIFDLHDKSKELLDAGFTGLSVLTSCTAIECTFRDLIFHPLVSGSFAEKSIADIVLKYFLKSARGGIHKLILKVLNAITALDLNEIKRGGSEESLWQEIKILRKERNDVAHYGADFEKPKGERALEVAKYVYEVIFMKVLDTVGMGVSSDNEIVGKYLIRTPSSKI